MTITDTAGLPAIEISLRARDQVARGYLWIFSNEMRLKGIDLTPGTWCRFTHKGAVVGLGYLNRHSLIAGRVITTTDTDDLQALLSQRLTAAFTRRRALLASGACRLLFSEADLLPGLVLDWYSGMAVAQSNTAGIDTILPMVEELVPRIFEDVSGQKLTALVMRGDAAVRMLEGIPEFSRLAFGDEAALADGSFTENGVAYAADFIAGQKTGFFLDQKENRLCLDRLEITGRTAVLDLFCYSGGWGLRAAKRGAGVTFVDESPKALELVKRGVELNNLDPAQVRTEEHEAFAFLERPGPAFDVIIADPPAFVKSQKNLYQAVNAYEKLNRLCWRRLKPGGTLLTSSCSYHVPESEFVEIVRRAVAKERGLAHVVYRGRQAADHPVLLSMPETDYLKCVGLQKLT
jgi:23S rRNA (cytosine1962-C5)-methyltransferase